MAAVGLFMLALAGAADVVSAVFRNTILQLSVPDGLRGRLSSVHRAWSLAGRNSATPKRARWRPSRTARFSVVSGGLACIVGVAALVRWVPELARYDALAETRRLDG